jgi:transcriptional regulator GlxA family with amidase domain
MRQSRLGVSQHSTSIGVRFYPGTALTFLGHSLADMQERVVPLNELWGASANRLLDQLIATGSFTQRIAIIEDQLLAQLRRSTLSDSHVTHAIKWIYADRGRPQVRDLAKAVGLCERQLSRKFPIWTGYTPKQFVRVLRFQHALESILHSPATGAATIAAQHGYADQSHMINEFAELGGGTPRALRHAAVSMTDECPIFSIPTPGTMRYHRAP